MRKILVTIPLLLAAQTGFAEGFTMGTGYNFIPGSYYLSMGYQKDRIAFESKVISMGEEEPDTKPGPEITLDVLAYAPSLPMYVRAGYVFGGGKNGYNIGVGFDYKLSERWTVRVEDTYFKVQEDYGDPAEGEQLFSIGLKYKF